MNQIVVRLERKIEITPMKYTSIVFLLMHTQFLSCAMKYPQKARIVGGNEVNIRDFPWQVSLLYKGRFVCGGSIISHDFVVTAAHCIGKKNILYLKVRVGSSFVYSGGRVYTVIYIKNHPRFLLRDFLNDISLLRLNERLVYSPTVKPVRLPERYNEQHLIGEMAWISGYGAKSTLFRQPAQFLRATKVPIISKDRCRKMFAHFIVDESMICAGFEYGGNDACTGDSGGPLTINGVLYGIVSWGKGCGSRFPGVYTSIIHLRGFIRDIARI